MIPETRRYDIDWLRVIAIALLLVYHIGIGFQPWGVFIGFIQNDRNIDSLWVPMSMLNVWRIPLLFFVSGMGVCFAMRKRNLKMLLLERSRRILLPFIFGIIAIVPLHIIIWELYYRQDISYSISQGHLWFLANIFSYVLILSPLLIYLKKKHNGRVHNALSYIYRSPFGLLLVSIIFVAEAVIMAPETYETYSLTLHGYILGLLSFFFGFSFVYAGSSFWDTVLKWRWIILILALGLFITRCIFFDLQSPVYLRAFESNLWIFSAFGFSYKYLNRPSPALKYLTGAAYPVYIVHMIFLYLASYLVMPAALPAAVKLIIIITVTFAGCLVSYEYIIRRTKITRIFFGLK
jgi:glucan biosynthesis protein C